MGQRSRRRGPQLRTQVIKAVNGCLESEQKTVSAREILLGCSLNEKKGFPVEPRRVLHFLLALLQDCGQQRWHPEEAWECPS